ncbi:TRAP transporter large permease subunit [Yoonia maritima]|nr:TRAP transporter large permease subunit [Yoonia maritima]
MQTIVMFLFSLAFFAAGERRGYLAGQLGWSQALANWVESFGLTGTKYLFFLVVIFLIAGMFMDTPVALTLLIPLFAPQAMEQGISSIQLGIVLRFNLCIGLITPPLGKCLVVVSALTNLNYWRLAYSSSRPAQTGH